MALKNLSLLYVEDEKEIALLMKELLEDEVGNLYIAHDGEEGLQMYNKYKPDIVLSDIYMPKIDGLSMSETIKAHFPDQPIVLLTAFNNANDLKRAIQIGIDNYINKPVLSQEALNIPLQNLAKKIDAKKELIALSGQIQCHEKFATIGKILELITHQWKQPLSVISANIGSLQVRQEMGTLTEEDLRTFMNTATERITYLSQTIDDFRDYLKPSSMVKTFELTSVFYQINSLLGAKLLFDKVTLVLPNTDIVLTGHKNKLVHVIINLLTNACDAFEEKKSEHRYIFVDVKEEDDKCILSVKDSAGGIDQEVIGHVFESHFTTKSSDKGTGIGLYMAHEFITRHMNGEFHVENTSYTFEEKELSGARFILTFPKHL